MISTYTICSNPLLEYYPIKEMILTNLQFAEEVVVADFNSTDGTLELLKSIQNDIENNPSKYYGNLKIIKGDMKYENTEYFYPEAKNQALDACTNDWVIRIDADEIIPEWCFENIKSLGKITNKNKYAFLFKRLHFYRDYQTIKLIPNDKRGYTYMFRKSTTARHKYVVGNCDGLIKESDNTFFDDLGTFGYVTVFHYSWCRPVKVMLKRLQRIEKKLIPFNDLRKRVYGSTRNIEQVNDWININPLISEQELEALVFDMRNTTSYTGKHPLLMYDIINNTMQIKKESKIVTPSQAYDIAIETSKKLDTEWNNFIKSENKINNITISACIITRNEPERIKDTILSVYPYVDEIIINDASDDDKTKHECLHDDFKFKIKYFKTEKTNNFSEERNKMQKLSTCDYCLHIDTDEKFPIEFLENMRNIIQKHLNKKIIPLMFRFSRSNVELDINKDPDYQIRFVNTLYTKWERNIHEIPIVIKNDEYEFHKEKMKLYNLIPTDYVIEHLKKDRTLIRERWNTLSNISTSCVNRKILICSMFKNSSKWLDDILKCVDNFIEYNNKVSNNNKLLVNLAFLKSTVDIETNKILDKYIENINQKFPSINVWSHKFDAEADIPRYEKLAWLRNYLIEQSTQNIKLNDNDLVLFMDSDVKFDKNIIHELILDMHNSNSDIIAPIICIDDYGVFKNNYFYDTLAFRNINNKNFSHFKPYIFGDIKKSVISEIKIKKVRESLEQIQLLDTLRKLNWEFNKNTPLNKTYPENLYKKAYELIDTNIPIEVNSVGSFYLMKYKVTKNIKYTGINDSEQVEFMNSARSKGYKIFVSQRLKVLHINLENYGLTWH